MSAKKDNNRMVDMLERMGMIKKTDDEGLELDQSLFEPKVETVQRAAPVAAERVVPSSPTAPVVPKSFLDERPQKSAATAVPVPPTPSDAPVAPVTPSPAPVARTAPAAPPVAPPTPGPAPVAAAPRPAPPALPVAEPPAARPAAVFTPPPVFAPAASVAPPAVQASPVMPPFVAPAPTPVQNVPYISPEMEKSMYSHLSVSSTFTFDKKGGGATASSLSDSFWDDVAPQQESVDLFLEIEELYNQFHMKTSGVDTVYLIEEYIKTLPDSLPAELRRSIIMRIVQASGFDFDKLLSDGIDRVSKLNDYAAVFSSKTDEIVSSQNNTIAELERQIELVRASINERKNLHKKQFLVIENEAQRLKEILDFITK